MVGKISQGTHSYNLTRKWQTYLITAKSPNRYFSCKIYNWRAAHGYMPSTITPSRYMPKPLHGISSYPPAWLGCGEISFGSQLGIFSKRLVIVASRRWEPNSGPVPSRKAFYWPTPQAPFGNLNTQLPDGPTTLFVCMHMHVYMCMQIQEKWKHVSADKTLA